MRNEYNVYKHETAAILRSDGGFSANKLFVAKEKRLQCNYKVLNKIDFISVYRNETQWTNLKNESITRLRHFGYLRII